jgi:hypothetical protein
MRQLNQTGFMSNRGRLVTANYLTRTLRIDWRKGEQYFATHLIDYDPAINNGNWQWVAGTGADRAPYFKELIYRSFFSGTPLSMQNLCILFRFPCRDLNPSIGTLVEPVQNL